MSNRGIPVIAMCSEENEFKALDYRLVFIYDDYTQWTLSYLFYAFFLYGRGRG